MKTVKNFLSKKVCDHLIHCHRQWFPQDLGEHIKKYHRNTETLLFENLMIRDSIMRQVYCKLIAFVKKAHPELYINHTEMVIWPTGKGQGPHLDFEDSTYTTLIYLNDNYKGGETYVNKELILKLHEKTTITKATPVDIDTSKFDQMNLTNSLLNNNGD